MTGEVYALLTQHGILGRLMELGGAWMPAAFDDGVRLGCSSTRTCCTRCSPHAPRG